MQDYLFFNEQAIGWAFPHSSVCTMWSIRAGLICLLLTNDGRQLLESACFNHFPYISLSSNTFTTWYLSNLPLELPNTLVHDTSEETNHSDIVRQQN